MLENVNLATDEEVERSKAIAEKLEDPKTAPKEKSEAILELETVNGKVRRAFIEETLRDLNEGVGRLLRGTLIKEGRETVETKIRNKAPMERYGWVETSVNGEPRMFDPSKPEEEREFREIPMTTVEKTKRVFICETNREKVGEIENILNDFLKKCRTDFKQLPIDKILEAKKETESAIGKVDRTKMVRETFSESDFMDATYIKKQRPQPKVQNSDADLFRKFASTEAAASAALAK